MAPQGIQTYQRTSIKTADRRRIIVMLYEGLIKNLHNAIDAIEAGDRETRTLRITKTLDIIQFLSASLDFEKGGEIARNLSNLYDFSRDSITTANITGDVKKLRESIDLFNVLLEGWKQIANLPEAATETSGIAVTRQTAPSPTSFNVMRAAAPRPVQTVSMPLGADETPRMRAVVG
jgi:flagellar secretion chaperone FliS